MKQLTLALLTLFLATALTSQAETFDTFGFPKATIVFPDGFEVVVPHEGDICVYDAVYCPKGFVMEDGMFPYVNQARFVRAVINNQDRMLKRLSEHYCDTVDFGPYLVDCDNLE